MHDIASFDITAYTFIAQLTGLYKKWGKEVALERAETAVSGNGSVGGDGVSVSIGGIEGQSMVLRAEIEAILQDVTWSVVTSDDKLLTRSSTQDPHARSHTSGSSSSVLFEELDEYIPWFIHTRLLECLPAITAFKIGFYSIIPRQAASLLSATELYHILTGPKEIDINRLKLNTEYDDDVNPTDIHIQYLWQTLYEFSDSERSAFLRFVWARPTLPPITVEFPQKFKIQSAMVEDSSVNQDCYLPRAHTCFFSINLPKYSSKEVSI